MPDKKEKGQELCDCGQEVKIIETEIIGGPKKGEKITYRQGCKCEDQKLGNEAGEARKRAKHEKARKVFDNNSLIPPKLKKAAFETYEPKNETQHIAKKAMQNYAKKFPFEDGQNALLSGTYGIGKSHLAVATIKEVMQRGHTGIFCSVPKLISKIKESWDDDDVKEAQLMRYIETVDLLVLDDIGAEVKRDWRTEKIFEIIDGRSGRHTIFTTNHNKATMEQHIGARNYSRLLHDTEIITMTGKDMRVK